MEADLPKLAKALEENGLIHKAFFELNYDEKTSPMSEVISCITLNDCIYEYICEQVPLYKATCKGQDKCVRLAFFAKNQIPKRGNRD